MKEEREIEYTPAQWQQNIPEAIDSLLSCLFWEVKPHGMVNMHFAKTAVRSYLPKAPLRDVELLIRCCHRSLREQLGLPVNGVMMFVDDTRFPYMFCTIYSSPLKEQEAFDDVQTSRRLHTNLSVSGDALATEVRYSWVDAPTGWG